MQQKTKLTIILTAVVLVFIFVIAAIIYQYFILAQLQKSLQEKNATLQNYATLCEQTNQKIQQVQTSEYIQWWARSELGWVGETQTKIQIEE